MKLSAGMEKWGTAVLGVVAALLVAHLVSEYRSWQPGNSSAHAASPAASSAKAEKSTSHAADDLAEYDPTVHFDALKQLDSRPLPGEGRNPFEYVGEAAPLPLPPKPVPVRLPPPPPPPPIKAMGYNELPGGKGEGMVSFKDDMEVVHEGDVVGGKYKVVKITPTAIVFQDAETQKTFELSFPQ